jgi:hypothetical protein
MTWTTPEFFEIKMDAEIGAYQPDDFGDEVPFVAARAEQAADSQAAE